QNGAGSCRAAVGASRFAAHCRANGFAMMILETLLQGGLYSFLWTAFWFLIVLTILVFVHEFGHYLIARWNRVRVEVFSIGFGPELFGWWDSAGTRWKFSTLPLGGCVKVFGESDASSGLALPGLALLAAAEREVLLQ